MPKNKQKQFVLCVRNEDAEDLDLRKVYEVLPDRKASQDGYLHVIDESGEDYLTPSPISSPSRCPPRRKRHWWSRIRREQQSMIVDNFLSALFRCPTEIELVRWNGQAGRSPEPSCGVLMPLRTPTGLSPRPIARHKPLRTFEPILRAENLPSTRHSD